MGWWIAFGHWRELVLWIFYYFEILLKPTVHVGSLDGRYVGMGVASVKRLFAKARKHRKSIIYIDEIDFIGRSRNRLLFLRYPKKK